MKNLMNIEVVNKIDYHLVVLVLGCNLKACILLNPKNLKIPTKEVVISKNKLIKFVKHMLLTERRFYQHLILNMSKRTQEAHSIMID